MFWEFNVGAGDERQVYDPLSECPVLGSVCEDCRESRRSHEHARTDGSVVLVEFRRRDAGAVGASDPPPRSGSAEEARDDRTDRVRVAGRDQRLDAGAVGAGAMNGAG